MTNREYQHKQHRGSTPSRSEEKNNAPSAARRMPSEEWKNQTWYPFSAEPFMSEQHLHQYGAESPDA